MLFFQSAFLEKHFGAESERLRNYYYFHFATRQWGGTALAATCQARSGLRPRSCLQRPQLAPALGASPSPRPGSREPPADAFCPPRPRVCVSSVNSRATAVCGTHTNTKSGGCPALPGPLRLRNPWRPGRAPEKGLHCPPTSQDLRWGSRQAFGTHAHGNRKRRCRRCPRATPPVAEARAAVAMPAPGQFGGWRGADTWRKTG